MLRACFLTTSTDSPRNANSEHYKQKRRLSVHRPERSLSPERVCVCVCVLMLDRLTTANQSRDCSVYLGQSWTWKQCKTRTFLRRLLDEIWTPASSTCCFFFSFLFFRVAMWSNVEPCLKKKGAIKNPVPAEEVILQMMSWYLMIKHGEQDTIRRA